MKSTNGGASWAIQDAAFPAESISCFTIESAPRSADSQIVETTDGSHWNSKPHHGTELAWMVSHVPTAITCIAVGSLTTYAVDRRHSRWSSWTMLDQPPVTSLTSRFMRRDQTYVPWRVATAGGGATSTEHGRLTDLDYDAPRSRSERSSNAVACPNATTCIAVGTNLSSTPYVVGTSNNGSTWSLQTPPTNAVDLTGISCSAAEDCIAVGNTGNLGAGSTIMGTTTGGLSWTAQTPPPGTSRLGSVSCPSTAECFAVGVDSVLASFNEGYAWTAQAIPSEVNGLNAISCATTSDCTAVGFGIFGSPVIIGTVNAGATWTSEPVPSGVGILTGVSCASPAACHAVSDFGSSSPSIIATAQRRRNMGDGAVPRNRHQLHRRLVPGCPALHRRGPVVRRTERGDPRHRERRGHLGPPDAARRRDHSQRHLVLQRHNLSGDRIPRDRHD